MREKLSNLNQAYSILMQEENYRAFTENSWSVLSISLVPLGETSYVTFARIKVTLLVVALKNMGILRDVKRSILIPKGKLSQANNVVGYEYLSYS